MPRLNSISAQSCYGREKWGPNLDEFQSRFDPVFGPEEGPQRLKNLYFTYLVELRALEKAAPYLEQVKFLACKMLNKGLDKGCKGGGHAYFFILISIQ